MAEGPGAVLPLFECQASLQVWICIWRRGGGRRGRCHTPLVRSPLSGRTCEILNENNGFSIDFRCPSVSTTRIVWLAIDGGSESAPARTRAAQSKYGRRTSFAASTYRARRFCGNFWATSWTAEYRACWGCVSIGPRVWCTRVEETKERGGREGGREGLVPRTGRGRACARSRRGWTSGCSTPRTESRESPLRCSRPCTACRGYLHVGWDVSSQI